MNHLSMEAELELARHYAPLFVKILPLALRQHHQASLLLGPAKKVERANQMKQAVRNGLAVACQELEPSVRLEEANECTGPDLLVIESPSHPVALRWGIKNWRAGAVRRNGTGITQDMYRSGRIPLQGMLFADIERDAAELPVFTVAYQLADEFTLAGVPQEYICRIVLCKEFELGTQELVLLAEFDKPEVEPMSEAEIALPAIREAEEHKQIRETARRLRRTS